jgi:hypothetical protein
MTDEYTAGTQEYEAPALVILGPAEDLTQAKIGNGSDLTSAFHVSGATD